MSDLQIAGDWKNSKSVESYAKANIAKKRAVLETKVIPLSKIREQHGNNS